MPRPRLASEVLYIPHLQSIRWARDLNDVLSGTFNSPYDFYADDFFDGRSKLHTLSALLFPWIRENRPKAVFFGHLTIDFIADLLMFKPGIQVWGFCHSLMSKEAGKKRTKLGEWEDGVLRLSDKVFTASKAFASTLPVESEVIGLPLFGKPRRPSMSPTILWSHRLSPKKGYHDLLNFPLRDRLIVTSPDRHKGAEKVLSNGFEFYPELASGTFLKFRDLSGYALSTSKQDNFGYSILEAVWEGKTALVPDNPSLGFTEYLPEMMRYSSMDELVEKIKFLDKEHGYREKLVLHAQENLMHLYAKTWQKNLLNSLGVDP